MKYFKLETYLPADGVEQLKNALAAAGAGKMGNYDGCFWQTEGTGQFRPLPGSSPFIGSEYVIERVREIKLETLCAECDRERVVSALKANHPYETPAFYLLPLEMEEK